MEKIKNFPVMRLAAFAVAVAIILGLSSAMLSFTASADTADDLVSQLGTLGNYDCIKFTAGQKIDFMTLYNRVQALSSTYVNGAIFGYKDGKFTSFTNNSFLVRPSTDGLYYDFVLCSNVIYGAWLLGDKSVYDTAYAQFGLFQSNYCGMWVGVKDNEPTILGATKLAASPQDFYDANGEIMYLVFTGSNNVWSSQDSKDFRNDIVNNLTDRDYKDIDTGTSPTAEFVTCASYTSDDNSIPLWFKDFTSEGQQFPLFTYYIHDNGNKHSYSLKLSYSSSAKDDVKKVFNLRENTKEDTDATIKDVVERIVAMYAIHGVKMHDLTPYLRTALNLKFPNNLTYNQAFVLSSPEMDFSATGNNKVYTICLSDYSDIIQCLIYKAEIIDNNTGLVLDTTYFTSKQTFNKGNSGFGSKVYDYDNRYDDMINDIKNNTPSVEPDNKGNFGVDGDIIQTGRYDYYTGLKIDDIFGSLESSASSLGSFFQACMSIIPAGILAVIIGGLSIVIILRILGR